jgi:hypothetical protein
MLMRTDRGPVLAARFDEALRLRDEGDSVGALSALMELVQQIPEDDVRLRSHIHIQISYLLEVLDQDPEKRELHCRAAVSAVPDLELASLALFHNLWASGKQREALKEVVRFLGHRDSAEYRELFTEEFCEALTGANKALAEHSRVLLDRYSKRDMAARLRS